MPARHFTGRSHSLLNGCLVVALALVVVHFVGLVLAYILVLTQ
jgi:hypothetical protein